MKAFWRDSGEAISPARLNEEGVFYRPAGTDPREYQPVLDDLKSNRGYTTQDEVALSPDTPNLEKFDGEHYHDEDEVRFVLGGAGVFDIRSAGDRWMRIRVDVGDLIVVPAHRYHRFELTGERSIHCVRLFQDASGWVPHYRD